MTSRVVGIRCGVCGYEPKKEENIIPGRGDKCPVCNQRYKWQMIGEMMR
jgi:rubrerythrin